MGRDEIIAKTIQFLADEFEVDPELIVPENNLHETLELDSLDYVDLVVVIEENLGFKATKEDFESVQTFNDFYDVAEKKVAQAA